MSAHLLVLSVLCMEKDSLKSALIRVLSLPNGASFKDQKEAIGDEVLRAFEPSELEELEKLRVPKNKKKTKKSVDNEEIVAPRALRQEEEEKVRQVLREALTEEQLKAAIEMAKGLEMGFEVSLGEKKLEKFVTETSTRE